ncbi:MAG: 4Fe-4S binding protein [Rhodocyclales bacterium]|nr:4Fe-4S binding protein [Rhodocyclales bacterium]
MKSTRMLAALLLGWLACAAAAGELKRDDIERRFGSPLRVGDKLRDIPAWPLTSELAPDGGPVGYVFESIDLAPIPGFEGTPMNLLVAIDGEGRFLDVEVLRQHEPVFLGGLGPAPLHEFVTQYRGKSLRQDIAVASGYGSARAAGGTRAMLDGVSKATASVRIANQTVLAAALAVARARLGFAAPGSGLPAAVPKRLAFERLDFDALVERGYVQRLTLGNAEVERLFAGSDAAGSDAEALRQPDALFVEVLVAYLNAPNVGRNLLGDAAWAELQAYLQDERPAFWIATRGRQPLVDAAFVPGTPPPLLALAQRGLPLELRDANRDYARVAGVAGLNAALILTVPAHAGLDPGQPMEFRLTLSRARGEILPVVTQRQAVLDFRPPAALFDYPPRPRPEWLLAWQARLPDLAAIGAALVLLTLVLLRPRALAARPRRLLLFRCGFLAFTLVFIGWYAQGQLSVVQITGALKATLAGTGLHSFLYDPVSLLLIAYTAATLAFWGRATFCGWLCPFGALQEFVGLLARALRLPQRRLSPPLARLLARGRFALLALLVAAAALAPALAENLVEIEPFKTAITLGFRRELPFLLWTGGLLLAGAFVYKFYCRFVCPLAAALIIGGRLRRRRWLARFDACGQPCQRCRRACRYDAIAVCGDVDYDACVQCLDCVGIYHDAARCGPRRAGRKAASGQGTSV